MDDDNIWTEEDENDYQKLIKKRKKCEEEIKRSNTIVTLQNVIQSIKTNGNGPYESVKIDTATVPLPLYSNVRKERERIFVKKILTISYETQRI